MNWNEWNMNAKGQTDNVVDPVSPYISLSLFSVLIRKKY